MEGKGSLERIFAQLSDEQKEQFRNCKDMDEVMQALTLPAGSHTMAR